MKRRLFQTGLFLFFMSSHLLMADEVDEDASLKEFIRQILTEHPDVKAAHNRMLAQKANVSKAKAGKFPTVDIETAWGKQRRNNQTTRSTGHENSHLTRQELSLNLRQPLFAGHAIDNRIKQSINLYQAREQEWLSTTQDTALAIAEVYFTILSKRRQLELAEDNHVLHKKIYDQIRQRVTQGLASGVELSQMEGRTARAEVNLMEAKNNLDDAKSEFFMVTNQLPGKLPAPTIENEIPYGSLEKAKPLLMEHPLIKNANMKLSATENAYNVSIAAYYPTVNLEVDRVWNKNVDGVKGSDDNFQIMLKMRYNMFRGGADKAAVSESAYRMAETGEVLKKTHRELNAILEIAWSSFHYLQKQKPLLQTYVNASKQTRLAYKEQFELGQRSLLDLLDSSNELFQTQQRYTTVHYQVLYSYVNLLNAMGDLIPWLETPIKDK